MVPMLPMIPPHKRPPKSVERLVLLKLFFLAPLVLLGLLSDLGYLAGCGSELPPDVTADGGRGASSSSRRFGSYQAPPSGTGFRHVTGGREDTPARAVDLGSDDVDGSLPLARLAACDAGQIARYDGGWGCADESAGSGEANTASNLGAGEGVFASKSGVDLQFRSLVAGSGVTLTSSATAITIDVDAGGGGGFTAGGDLSGTSTSQTVEKIHGTTVPAGGTLAAGEVLRATGTSTADWGAVDLADTDAVTGTLPLANVGAPTGTGFAMVSGGVWQSSAFTDPLSIGNGGTGTTTLPSGVIHSDGTSALHSSQIVNADVNAAAAISCSKTTCTSIASSGAAGTVQTADGSGGLSGATNVVAGSGYLAIGASPATTGDIRTVNGFSLWSRTTTPANVPILMFDSSNELYIGSDSGFGGVAPQAQSIKLYASTAVQFGIGGTTYLYVNGGAIEAWKPITGSSGGSSPYGVHGETGAVAAPNGGTTTLSASEYKNQLIQVCSQVGAGTVGTGTGNVDFPTPAAGAGYWKWVYDGCQTGPSTLRRAGGGGNTTTGPAVGKVAGFWVTSGGVWRMTTDSTP